MNSTQFKIKGYDLVYNTPIEILSIDFVNRTFTFRNPKNLTSKEEVKLDSTCYQLSVELLTN